MLFGKRRESAASGAGGSVFSPVEPELYVVAYENMLKGNKLIRRGTPIRQAAVVVDGTVKLITSGDKVNRRTYDALIDAGIVAPSGHGLLDETPGPDVLPDPEGRA